jgi:hypothetical protein
MGPASSLIAYAFVRVMNFAPREIFTTHFAYGHLGQWVKA